MEVAYTKKAKEDIAFWKMSGNKKIMAKISDLITEIAQNPFEGTGKPEPLKYNLSGCWSRRINQEHRIIYEVIGEKILFILSRGIIHKFPYCPKIIKIFVELQKTKQAI